MTLSMRGKDFRHENMGNATKYVQKLVSSNEFYANLVGGTATKRSYDLGGSNMTRTLRENAMHKGWLSIQKIPFATYDITTPQSKTAQTTSNGRHST